ncbi:MAG: Crp/Fnr family transcriptional regulator [Candidatus Alcyoniella australis]|nr:Crp/Fnr family transcriptional regulator [Candidatus Alcyoniella australis]
MALICHTEQVKPQTLLFSEGEHCNRFYVLADGVVKIYRVNAQGREQILHLVHPRQSFAEAAIFTDRIFPASAMTLVHCELIAVAAEPFRQMLEHSPQTTFRFIGALAKWLRTMVDLVDDLSLKDVKTRLAVYLLRESRLHKIKLKPGAVIPLGMTKGQLAQRLGTVNEVISRALYSLQALGALEVGRHEVVVLDVNELERAASGD